MNKQDIPGIIPDLHTIPLEEPMIQLNRSNIHHSRKSISSIITIDNKINEKDTNEVIHLNKNEKSYPINPLNQSNDKNNKNKNIIRRSSLDYMINKAHKLSDSFNSKNIRRHFPFDFRQSLESFASSIHSIKLGTMESNIIKKEEKLKNINVITPNIENLNGFIHSNDKINDKINNKPIVPVITMKPKNSTDSFMKESSHKPSNSWSPIDISYGVSSLKGRRPYMEDAYCILSDIGEYGKSMGGGEHYENLSYLLEHRIKKSMIFNKNTFNTTTLPFNKINNNHNLIIQKKKKDIDIDIDKKIPIDHLPSIPIVKVPSNKKNIKLKFKDFENDIDYKTAYFGVFDGHAGNRCAITIASWLALYILNSHNYYTNLSAAIEEGHMDMDKSFLEESKLCNYTDGCTAVCILKRGSNLYISNVGDSRAILCSGKDYGENLLITESLTIDQKPNTKTERERIENAGGTVVNVRGVHRVNSLLAVARAFGDLPLKSVISAEPVINIRKIIHGYDKYVIMATDGLWDVMSNEDVGLFIRSRIKHMNLDEIANKLANHAIKLGSMDNITVLIVDLDVI